MYQEQSSKIFLGEVDSCYIYIGSKVLRFSLARSFPAMYQEQSPMIFLGEVVSCCVSALALSGRIVSSSSVSFP